MNQNLIGDRLFMKSKLKNLMVENKRENVKLNERLQALKSETNFEISKTNVEMSKLKLKLKLFEKRKIEFERKKNAHFNRFSQHTTSNNSGEDTNKQKKELTELELFEVKFESLALKSIKCSVDFILSSLESVEASPKIATSSLSSSSSSSSFNTSAELEQEPSSCIRPEHDKWFFKEITITEDDIKSILTKIYKKHANIETILNIVNDIIFKIQSDYLTAKNEKFKRLIDAINKDESNNNNDTTNNNHTTNNNTKNDKDATKADLVGMAFIDTEDNLILEPKEGCSNNNNNNMKNDSLTHDDDGDIWNNISRIIFKNEGNESQTDNEEVKNKHDDVADDILDQLNSLHHELKVMVKLDQVLKWEVKRLDPGHHHKGKHNLDLEIMAKEWIVQQEKIFWEKSKPFSDLRTSLFEQENAVPHLSNALEPSNEQPTKNIDWNQLKFCRYLRTSL